MPGPCGSTTRPTRPPARARRNAAASPSSTRSSTSSPTSSIAENIFIGNFPRGRGGLIDRAALADRTAALLAAVSLALPPDTLVERLSPGERQLVEVAKALQLDARLIIFDEPTTSLTSRETSRLFELIARLAAGGKTIVYISHILGDVQALADDIAVLRDGRLVATGPAPEFPVARMINLMLGRDIDQLYPPRTRASRDEVLLEARALTAGAWFAASTSGRRRARSSASSA